MEFRLKSLLEVKTKKSQTTGFIEWFFVIIVLFAFAIFFLILNNTWGLISPELNTGLTSSLEGHDISGHNVTNTLAQTTSTNHLFDNLLPFIIIGLLGFVMISAGAIMKHPIMIFVGLIILGVVITIAVIYANIYSEISDSAAFSTTSSELTVQGLFMKYLPYIAFIAAISVVVALIWRSNPGGGGL